MEKMLLKTKDDLQKAIGFFGTNNSAQIKKVVGKYPCVLIGNYADDIEFGDGYSFCSVSEDDFKRESGKSYMN